MKQFFSANLFYPNVIYPVPSIQQTPKYVTPNMITKTHGGMTTPIIPQQQAPAMSKRKYENIKKRASQIFFDVLGIATVFIAYGIVIAAMDPYTRNFSCDMSDIIFPKVQEFVPLYALLMFGLVGPVVLIILVEMYNTRLFPFQTKTNSLKERFTKFMIITVHALTLFAFGVGTVLLLTSIIHRWTSKLRPNFLAICKPSSNLNCITQQVGVGASGSIFNSISTGGTFCTGQAADIKEARMSFPSGHASFSTFTMLFLVIYLQARLVSLRFRALRPLLQIAAIIAALVTSVSRYIDYYADAWDIVGGAMLGSLIGIGFTIYLSRVLWDYEKKAEYSEFHLEPQNAPQV